MSGVFYPLPIPTQKTQTFIISSYTIVFIDVVPNTSANIRLQLYAPDQTCSGNMALTMSGEDYQRWTSDDYLLAWIDKQIYAAYPIPE